jgi:hypothetical protein
MCYQSRISLSLEDTSLLVCDAVWLGKQVPTLQRIVMS